MYLTKLLVKSGMDQTAMQWGSLIFIPGPLVFTGSEAQNVLVAVSTELLFILPTAALTYSIERKEEKRDASSLSLQSVLSFVLPGSKTTLLMVMADRHRSGLLVAD